MRITVLGGCGAWPTAGEACSGFLVEYDDFRLLVDVGYATFPRLLEATTAEELDAVLISHGHPDHCADLNPLLRARALVADPPAALPVHAPRGALDAVLALDRPGMLDDAYLLREFDAGDRFEVGPFAVDTRLLPHWVPNAGMRITAGAGAGDGGVLAYTGDSGPSPDVVALARDADLLIAEATFPEQVPPDDARYLTSAEQAGRQAADAGVARLLLTHLWPGTDPDDALTAAAQAFPGALEVAVAGLVVDVR
jgi:ribonuclease BN (tRNA processing enzyme)